MGIVQLPLFFLIALLSPSQLLGKRILSPAERDNMINQVLKSHKISNGLKVKLVAGEDDKPEGINIMIEFHGGNNKAIQDYRNGNVAGRATAPRGEKISSLVDGLQNHAQNSQEKVIQYLKEENVEHRPLWAANEIYVKGASCHLIYNLEAKYGNIATIRQVAKIHAPKPLEPPYPVAPTSLGWDGQASDDIPWHITQVNGRCKEITCLGEGVVVAIVDSGVMHTHVELDNWRRHYGWYDPINGSLTPTFTSKHGTHCAGIAVGKTKGIAPNAQWIACLMLRKDMDEEVYLKACGEWALCPTKPDGTDRDCSMAPDIISCSWNINNDEQQNIPRNMFYGIQAAWNEAGILSYFAAGNAGPYCTTVDPPALYDITFSVGAVDNTSTAPYWSSRGPALNLPGDVTVNEMFGTRTCKRHCAGEGYQYADGNGQEICFLTKPEISAPGVRINSSHSDCDTCYIGLSGTSMATPLVAGVAALMVCANKQAGHQRLDWLSAGDIIKETADTSKINLTFGNQANVTTNQAWISNIQCNMAFGETCGTYPNNVYGWGEINACSAVRAVKHNKVNRYNYKYN